MAKAKAKSRPKPRRRRSAVPPILPRERLTRKAFEAISTYAAVKCGDLPLHYFMVRAVLEAERMRRRDLYEWLESRGYRWRYRRRSWVGLDKNNP